MSAPRPRVLMVGPWPPTKGGITTFMLNVTRSRLNEKYDFVPFTTSRPAKPKVKGDNYGYLAAFRGGFKRVLQGMFVTLWHLAIFPSVVLGRRPAVVQVHASDFQAFWEATLYVLMGKLLRRAVVLRIGGSFNRFYESSGPVQRAAIRWALNRPDFVVAQSEFWRAYLGRLAPAASIGVLNNFVPETLLEERTVAAPAVCRFLLYCGWAPELKGAYVLLAALRGLLARGVKADITLVAVTDFLREEVAAAGLAGHCTLLGVVSREEALQSLRAADVFLQISSSEGFPNMLLEAMAVGCAAIVTPVGAVPEVVDGDCAFVIDVGDAAALAERMARLAGDPVLVARLGAAARARVAERFTDRAVLDVLDQIYQSVMGGRGAGRPSASPPEASRRTRHEELA